MANKRLPDNVHKLRGTLRKDRHGDPSSKPKLKNQIPRMPTWLNANGKAEWKRITKEMKKMGIITNADRTVLAQYCQLYSELVADREEFTAAKHTQLRYCQIELGLTPSARSKITLPGGDEGNPFDDL